MNKKKRILAICGSASNNSANLSILKYIAGLLQLEYDFEIIESLSNLPSFRTELTDNDVPEKIIELRGKIENADGIIICTPEYIFSIPSGLKNMIEWCVSTTVFSDKPVGLITASASGLKGHEELKLIMKTVQTHFTEDTTLLIQGVKGKIDATGVIRHEKTEVDLHKFIKAFKDLTEKTSDKNIYKATK